MRLARILGWGIAVSLSMPAALDAQGTSTSGEAPPTAPIRLGPLALAPTLTVSNLGWDSNVFQVDADPASDFTGTARPETQAWLRLGPARLRGRSALDFVYFQDHPSERSVDADNEARLDLPLARIRPYTTARWIRAREPFGFEIDQRIRRSCDLIILVARGTECIGAERYIRRDRDREPG